MHAPGAQSRRKQWRHIRAQANAETQRFRSDVDETLRKCDRAHRATSDHKDHHQHSSSRRTVRPQTAPALRRRPDTPSHRFADLRPSRVHEDHGVYPSFWSQTKRKLPERALLDGRSRAFAGLCNPVGSLFSHERVLDQPSELAYERGLREHSALFAFERENMIEINRSARIQLLQQQQQRQRQQTSERRSQTAPAALLSLPHQRRCWDFDAPPPKTFAATAPPELGLHGHGGGVHDVIACGGGKVVVGTKTVNDGSAMAVTMGMARSAAEHRDRKVKGGAGWGGDDDGGPHEKSKDGTARSSHSHTTTTNNDNHHNHYGVTPRELNTVFARLQLAGGNLLFEDSSATTANELRPIGDTADKFVTFRATCIHRTGRVPVPEQGIKAAWVDTRLFAATWLDIDELVALFQVRSVCRFDVLWSCLSLVLLN